MDILLFHYTNIMIYFMSSSQYSHGIYGIAKGTDRCLK